LRAILITVKVQHLLTVCLHKKVYGRKLFSAVTSF